MDDQAAFRNLEQFHLSEHGDAREKATWPSVSDCLSAYEMFWRTFIVLLTNRIDSQKELAHDWIRLRPGIPRKYETLAMSNYSVLYYAASALQEIDNGRSEIALGRYCRPELVFFQLQVCVENMKRLLSTARALLRELNVNCRLPKQPQNCFQTIGAYRNAFSHDPVLGRAATHRRELIPPAHMLPKTRKKDEFLLWSDTDKIPEKEMADCLKCQEQLWNQLAAFMQKMWESLSECFLRARTEDKFIKDVGLSRLLPICSPVGILSTASPFTASGTFIGGAVIKK